MALKVTSRDIQEIVSKLSSDKAKAREEGVKLLNTWLETDRSIGFCRYLSDKTSVLKPNEVPHAETWPFLVKILMQCASSEISSSKKRLPKSIFAKTLRIIVQRAQDDGCSGKKNLLLHVAKSLFNHVWDVLKDVPSFQSEYGVILRYLLEVTYYRFHMRKRVYSNLVLLYMEKVETSLSTENFGQINPKEEVFRFTLTLHSLIENPPGDIPEDLRDNIISGFIGIFSHVRDEGKISRKLVECINTYLLKDGPNLGGKSLEIHQAVNHFVFRYWFATHDRCLKDSLICYAKLQVSLTRGVDDGSILLELVDVMSKELDQMSTSSTNSPWGEKCGIMTSSQFKLAELAALVFCRVCANTYKSLVTEKRARREHVVVLIKERVMEGKWPWHAALVCLIRNYSTRIRKDHLLFWFDSISANFERIINAGTLEHSYDDLFWTLQSLLRLSLLMLFAAPNEKSSQKLAFPLNEDNENKLHELSGPLYEVGNGWHVIWNCLMRSLPTFCNLTSIVDAAFTLLCSIMLSDTKDSYLVPLEIWDLRLFKRTLSTVLMLGNIFQVCFVLHLMLLLQENLAAVMVVGKYLKGAHFTVDIVKSMMTMRSIQGDLQDFLYLRQNVLPAVLAILNLKEFTTLNERFVVLLPAAAYALSTGCTPLLYEASGLLPLLYATEPVEELAKIEESPSDFLECSVEVLAKIDIDSGPKVNLSNYCQNVRLPLNLRDQLHREMENHVLECIKEVEIDKMLLSEVIYTCALLANFMFCSYSTRIREIPPFFYKLGESLLGYLNHAISIVEKYYNDGLSGCLEWNSIINNIDSTATSFKSFTSSPLLSNCQEKNIASSGFYFGIVQSSERLLKALAKLYEGCSECRRNSQAKPDFPDLSDAHSIHDLLPLNNRKKLILDVELDMNGGSIDVDRLGIDGSQTTGSSISLVNQKLNFLAIISSFFPILSFSTWEIMFNLKEKENDPQVLENFLCILSRHPHWSSCRHILDLVTSMTDVVNSYENLKFPCSCILDGICCLVASLLQSNGVGTQNTVASSSTKRESEECLTSLGDLVTKVFDNSLFDWYDRAKLVNCICNFVLLRPQLAQLVIDKLFMLLRDPDYRVRLCLARRIGVLFQTWDGHSELFQDVCSNFGRKLVTSSGEKIVRAQEVLSAGPQPRPIMETIVITLMHLVLHSEKIELEAVFMISVVAAIDPSQRELVSAVLDSLSKEACYTNRTKFLEELMGPILFNWVACGVSLVALVEARDIFTSNLEPMNFIKYCCPWLLPALILQEDANSLKWVAKVACQTCAALVKRHFVHIFSVCMAMHCSKKAGWERGSRVLETSILLIVNISEHERDELIKKQMGILSTENGQRALMQLNSYERSLIEVYWLSVDYLMAAKSAIKCGSYFSAVLYVEYWCEEHFNSLTLGSPDFSPREMLQSHIEILASAVTQINEPDSLYGIIQSHKLSSQITTFQHEGNWSKALEYLDLQARFELMPQINGSTYPSSGNSQQPAHAIFSQTEHDTTHKKPYKGLVRSLQQIGCTHVLDVYCQGLTTQRGRLQHDLEFAELQYEAAWRAGNWDFCSLYSCGAAPVAHQPGGHHFNENLHGCLRALQEGDYDEFYTTLRNTKQDLLMSIFHASKESTEYIYSTLVKLQIFYHLGMAWDLRWNSSCEKFDSSSERQKLLSEPVVPSMDQLQTLHKIWIRIFKQAELHMNMLEPFIAFRRVLLQVLNSSDSTAHHLLESASILRKGCRTSQAAAALHEFKYLCSGLGEEYSNLYWLGRLEEAKLLRAQGQHEMAINLADHISQNRQLKDAADVFRLVGKWLAETRSSNSRTILEKYLKHAIVLAGNHITTEKLSAEKRSQMHFNLAHYADALFRSHEERLNSNEWHVAIRLRKHKTKELEALLKRLKTSKGDKIDYSLKIQELQKQLSMDKGEAEKLQEDRDKFLSTAVEGYKQCLIIGEKYDVQVVFRLVSMWFSLTTKEIAIDSMLSTIKQVQSYKFIPLVYQIASRMGGNKDSLAPKNFQFALVSLVKKMALDHPYHTIFQLLALANGDRIKDKQRSRNSFVVDVDKKVAAEDLLRELSAYHGAVISQMKQMVEIYIKLAELETKSEDTNKKVTLPRELRGIRELELVPVVTSNFPVDQTCQYPKGFFPHFRGLADSVTIMNGINAPKVVECLGSDGMRYRQLAKSGNDDLRQDAVMEQFFGLVNTFLQKNRDTWKRRLRIRTYKVVPFTPSAGVLEWVNGTVPLGEYLIGSSRNGGAHGRYGVGDWTFLKCRQHVTAENNKSRAFLEVCKNFRPVMHYFFLERFRHPADWFDKRLAYTRSVAASSMVGYIVGLGDRHSMNVLIDQSSAEVVHIDLGVAFEQGLMLKTPERVPFRLTRDIIDGMGVTGVEGVFRRCCEETLSVMRTNKEALLTIIEVFIHDPLYKWALSPLKAMQRQKDIDDDLDANLEDSDEDEYEGNKDAARALLRVKQKLDGYEDGEMRSVHGQVQQLIQDAIDPDRLCHMFPGWGAWL
ncbi:serine/threonine-protein kinase ATM isoform X6 [Primulina tabacum]|uniref:serine/threonine-protein kinase ATM isoform X6 n=1 Tax=Primulina tabacum TaxID=48773 RepID=UPI003F597E3A